MRYLWIALLCILAPCAAPLCAEQVIADNGDTLTVTVDTTDYGAARRMIAYRISFGGEVMELAIDQTFSVVDSLIDRGGYYEAHPLRGALSQQTGYFRYSQGPGAWQIVPITRNTQLDSLLPPIIKPLPKLSTRADALKALKEEWAYLRHMKENVIPKPVVRTQ